MSVFSPDTLAALPALSRAKILHLEDQRRSVFARAREAEDRENAGKERLAPQIRRLEAERGYRLKSCDNAAEEQAVRDEFDPKIDLATQQLSHLKDAHERALSALAEFAFLERANTWTVVMVRRGEAIQLCRVEAGKPRAADYRAEVEKVRKKITALAAEQARIEAVPFTPETVLEEALAEIDALASRGKPVLDVASEEGAPLGLDNRLSLSISGESLIGDGGAAFFVWLCKDLIVERLTALIGDTDFSNAMTKEQRNAALDKLIKEKLELEHREEALIDAAADVQQVIPRRPDADPRAILMVNDV